MMGSRRSNRVSWATGPNLCKVRLFLSDDSPSQAGLRPQDNLQAKGSWLMHAAGPSLDDSLPPGFESVQPTNNVKIDVSKVPLIRWRCPPKMLFNPDWHVVAGEESEEIALQNERIFGALEAIYPRPSNIPPNPFVSPDVIASHYDDSQTQLVPLIPIEEDDTYDQLEEPLVTLPNNYHQSESAVISVPRVSDASITTTTKHKASGLIGAASACVSTEPDVSAAASAAYTAIMQSNQMGSMIDQDLLIKILSDPAQLERLMKEHDTVNHEQSTTSAAVAPMLPRPQSQMAVSATPSFPDPMVTYQNLNHTLPPPPPVLNRLPPAVPSVSMNPPASSSLANNFSRGINYYKNLIHQHGGERQEPPEQYGTQFGTYQQPNPTQTSSVDVANSVTVQVQYTKVRLTKPCAYFNTARGVATVQTAHSCTMCQPRGRSSQKERNG